MPEGGVVGFDGSTVVNDTVGRTPPVGCLAVSCAAETTCAVTVRFVLVKVAGCDGAFVSKCIDTCTEGVSGLVWCIRGYSPFEWTSGAPPIVGCGVGTRVAMGVVPSGVCAMGLGSPRMHSDSTLVKWWGGGVTVVGRGTSSMLNKWVVRMADLRV